MKSLHPPAMAPTPYDTLYREGTSRLLHFRGVSDSARAAGPPVLLVPSMIHRWSVLDLRPGGSLVAALLEAGLDVYCLDWGVPEDEDRFRTWDDAVARVARAVRRTQRHCELPKIALLGFSLGATLGAIHTALQPDAIAAFVNLAGPIDFSHAGCLARMVDARWFDAEAIASAGNISGAQIYAGIAALRPMGQLARLWELAAHAHDPSARAAFFALEAWVNEPVPFPAAAYVRYIRELYQGNDLVRGAHHIAGRRVDLRAISCPVRVVVATQDAICPPAAATALLRHCSTRDGDVLTIPGGHVTSVVGPHASTHFYPALAGWLKSKQCN